MSVRCISKVIEESAHAGTDLLMLIVLANYSDDFGNSYPSVATLARKSRMSPRHANRILAALSVSGELDIRYGKGPRGTNRYRINLSALGRSGSMPAPPDVRVTPGTDVTPEVRVTPGADVTLTPVSAPPDMDVLNPLTPMSPKPSLNRQEPSKEAIASVGRADLPACRTQEIVDAFHAALPELPAVRLMNDGRRKAIAKLWRFALTSTKSDGSRRATTAEEALAWIKTYFARTRDNDFLMGRGTKVPGHEGWRCDLDFLLTSRGMKHVIERTEASQ